MYTYVYVPVCLMRDEALKPCIDCSLSSSSLLYYEYYGKSGTRKQSEREDATIHT